MHIYTNNDRTSTTKQGNKQEQSNYMNTCSGVHKAEGCYLLERRLLALPHRRRGLCTADASKL